MKVYSLDPISVHQEDKNTAVKAHSPAQGMFLDTPQKLSDLPDSARENMVNKMIQAEGEYQYKQNVENNRYTNSMMHRKEPTVVNENPKEVIKPDNLDVREYVENGESSTVQTAGGSGADEDFCYEMRIPNSKHSLFIYNRCMHKNEKAGEPTCKEGGLTLPENSNCNTGAGLATGISFSEGVSFSDGIAYNDAELDHLLNSLNGKKGGAIPAIVGQLAMQLIPQIPAIISAIKQKRDDSKVGNGLLTNMQKYPSVRAVMNNLPEGKSASYYNDMIKEFNAFKRSASGISFNESSKEYYGTGKVIDGLRNFFGWIKQKYNDNKEVFKPIRDALVNAANNSLQSAVDTAAKKATDYVKSKTDNEDVHRIVNAAVDVGQAVTSDLKDKINTVGQGVQPERIYSVLN